VISAAIFLAAASVPAAAGDPLQPLSFLVGHCWRGEFKSSGNVDTHCFQPVYGGKHIRDLHEVTGGKQVYRGETVFSWNGEAKKVEFVYFNSLGGVSKGGMKPGADEMVFDDESYVGQDGKKVTFSTVWRRLGDNSYEAITKSANSASGERVVRYTRVD
jgi:hypothetical protein